MSLFLKIISSLIVVFVMAGVGSFFTMPSIDGWYAGINKPTFNPPNWIFGPVWTVLFILMAVSLAIVWEKRFKNAKIGLLFFIIQLILNAFWSILFFGFQEPLFALIEIFFLWFFILLTIFSFWKTSKFAAILLWPYLAWVSFASFLNLNIFLLN